MYSQFKRDLQQLDIMKSYGKYVDETYKMLQERLSLDRDELLEQLADIECRLIKICHIYAASKSLRDKAYAVEWASKGTIRHGEAKKAEAEVDDTIKEYSYLCNFLENMIDCMKSRLAFGKKVMEKS